MRPPPLRFLLNTATALSLALCALAVGLWIRGAFRCDIFRWGAPRSGTYLFVLTDTWGAGRMTQFDFSVLGPTPYPPSSIWGAPGTAHVVIPGKAEAGGCFWWPIDGRFLGVRLRRSMRTAPGVSAFNPFCGPAVASQFLVTVEYRSTAIVTSLLPAIWGLRRWRRRRGNSPPGRCAACGYDLRATPRRCPECGMVPETANAARHLRYLVPQQRSGSCAH